MDRHVVRLLVAAVLLATALFVLRGLLGGGLPAGATGLVEARAASGRWATALASGDVPLWSSSPAPGGPLQLLPSAQTFYPLRLLLVPFGPIAGGVLLRVLELFLLGAGMFALARTLGRTHGAALLAAVGAQLAPLVAGAALSPPTFASLCLTPWVVVHALRTARGLHLVDAALAGLLAATVLLAGSMEVTAGAIVAAGVTMASGLARGGARLVVLAFVSAALFALLTAVQWMPFFEAARAGVLAASGRVASPDFGDLARLLLPFTGVEPPRPPGAVDPWAAAHLLRSLYLGGPVILLALARPAVGGEPRTAIAGFAAAWIAGAPLAASLLARTFPGLGAIDPVTLAAPALLALPLLAAFGADAVTYDRRSYSARRSVPGPRLVLEAAVALLVCLAVALWLFASDAGILLSASVAWVAAGVVVLIPLVRGFDGPQATVLPVALAVLVAVDLGGVHLLDPPLAPEPPAPVADASGTTGDAGLPARPRVVVAARHELVAPALVRARADAADFDPSLVVLLDVPPPVVTDGGPGTATVTRDEAEEVHVHVQAPQGGWLLLADRWAPGWKAWVDGTPAAVLRANGTARAVPLPPGIHQVDLRYRPASWPLGLGVSGAGAALFLLAIVLGRSRAQRRAELLGSLGP